MLRNQDNGRNVKTGVNEDGAKRLMKSFALLTNEVLRLCRKVKLSVPHIVATPHFTREAHFTSEGHFTFRVSGTLS